MNQNAFCAIVILYKSINAITMNNSEYLKAKEFYFGNDVTKFNIVELITADRNSKEAIAYLEKYYPGDENEQKLWHDYRGKVLEMIGKKSFNIVAVDKVGTFYETLCEALRFETAMAVLKEKGFKSLSDDELFTLLNMIIDGRDERLLPIITEQLKERNLL